MRRPNKKGWHGMLRTLMIAVAAMLAMLSGGCTYATIEVMEEVDHAVSKIAQSDCELIRIMHFEPICDTPPPPERPEVFCYKRLGAVDCYAARDPIDKPILNPQHEQQAVASYF